MLVFQGELPRGLRGDAVLGDTNTGLGVGLVPDYNFLSKNTNFCFRLYSIQRPSKRVKAE